jgi:hypothetical protein
VKNLLKPGIADELLECDYFNIITSAVASMSLVVVDSIPI